jgi:hypothetical protein
MRDFRQVSTVWYQEQPILAGTPTSRWLAATIDARLTLQADHAAEQIR